MKQYIVVYYSIQWGAPRYDLKTVTKVDKNMLRALKALASQEIIYIEKIEKL